MTRNDLYDIAFRYKKAKLWTKLWDTDVFAVKLKSGDIGYVSIMGKNGEYNALGLYIGDAGFGSFRILANAGGYTGSEFKDHEMLLQQRCLQMALECKEDLMPEEVTEVREYAKEHGIRLSGKNAYPQFIKYEPNCHPWKVKTDEDINSLYEALEAAILLADVLKTTDPETIGIVTVSPETKEVPLFGVNGETLMQEGMVDLPGDLKEEYEYVKVNNQIAITTIKRLPKKGIWEAELIRMMEPVQSKPEETPYYPMLLLIVESKSFYILPVPMIEHAENNPQEVIQEYVNAWKMQGCYPKEIRCRDERTYALLKDISEKSDVKISIYKKRMEALDDAENSLLEQSMDGSSEDDLALEMAEAIDALLAMSREEIKMMPRPLIEQLKMMMENEVFPKEISDELKKKFKGI